MNSTSPNPRTIFCEALQVAPGDDRAAFLERACAGDAALRSRVEALLEAYDRAEGFLEGGAQAGGGRTVVTDPGVELIGTFIGPYKLLQKIGEGGMGVVYMAEQTHPVKRKVALKLIKPGLDTRQVIARFEAERQALALMDHPHIAKVLDAGTVEETRNADCGIRNAASPQPDIPNPEFRTLNSAAGRPYFVMELVNGVPITAYCDAQRFTPRERLELFIPVCRAVQHAHQKGIIHRDLKPSNVLIALYDGQPVPKVIDFGVAKAVGSKLTDKTLFTAFGSLVGTLEYMSPEQAERNQLDIDTRSDVYALGVLLYELLTGTTPLDKRRLHDAALLEVLRVIREDEPPLPSTRLSTIAELPSVAANRSLEPQKLSGLVRGELDWIVMKALEKDRRRRYETATGLAQDIERYLQDEPVQAGPPGVVYRLRKFVRRNRSAVFAATAIVVMLVAGVTGTSLGLLRALRARQIAVEARNSEARQRYAAEMEQARAVMAEGEARTQAEIAAVHADTAQKMLIVAQKNEQSARHEALRAETARYALLIEAARQAWERHDIREAERRLGEADAAFQNTWEQRFLRDLCRRSALSLTGHAASVSSTAFSADGKRLVTGSFDGTVRVWDAATGRAESILKGHSGRVTGVAISGEGRLIVSASALWDEQKLQYVSGELKLWDAATGDEIRSLAGHAAAVLCVAFSPDDRRIASGSRDETIRIWDAATGEMQLTMADQGYEVTGVSFSPDGTRIASWSGGNVKVYDAATGKEQLRFRGGQTGTGAVAFSPDGERLVTASGGANPGIPGEIRVWNAKTGERTQTFAARARWLRSIAFSPDGERIAAAGGEFDQPAAVQVWEAATGRELFALSGHHGAIYSVTFSPDGRRIVSGSQDGTARVWNPAATPEAMTLAGHQLPVSSLAFSPDGTHLATASSSPAFAGEPGDVRVWDMTTGREALTLAGDDWHARSLVVSPDGRHIVTGGGLHNRPAGVDIWDAQSGRRLHRLRGFPNYVVAVAMSADGRRLAALAYHDTIKLWDTSDMTEQRTFHATHQGPCTCLAVNGDGSRIITGSTDGSVKAWEAESGGEVFALQAHAHGVSSVAFSPDGVSFASGEGVPDGSFAGTPGEVKVWDAGGGELRLTLRGHTEPITGVTYSSDGRRIISAGRDRTVRWWDTATGQLMMTLEGGSSPVLGVAASPDGHSVAAGNADGTVHVWQVPPTAAPESDNTSQADAPR